MRLIDAERLSAEIFKASMDEHFMPMKLLDCDTITEIISNAPTIEERKTGKWEIEPKHPMDSSTFPHIKCTECGERPFGDFPTLYCPHCGAKLEGE